MKKEFIIVRHRGSIEEGVSVQIVAKDKFDLTGYSFVRLFPGTTVMEEYVPTEELEVYQKIYADKSSD